MKRVSGQANLMWTVELPDKFQHTDEGYAEDPAIGAVLEFISQMGKVWCFGDNEEPAAVFTEMHEEEFEIEDDDRDPKKDYAKCKSCKAKIFFIETSKGKQMPIDADPDEKGNIEIDGLKYRSHFATCPQAKEWRKGK